MPYHSRVLSKDEELGKRDDDFRPKRSHSAYHAFNILRWRKRRLFGLIAGLILVYLFVTNPPADLRRVDGQRFGRTRLQTYQRILATSRLDHRLGPRTMKRRMMRERSSITMVRSSSIGLRRLYML
jgi:hypothetical protein